MIKRTNIILLKRNILWENSVKTPLPYYKFSFLKKIKHPFLWSIFITSLSVIAWIFALSSVNAFTGISGTLDIWGFSPDKRIILFEEHGCDNVASGIAYSKFYAVDLARNKWLKDTPIESRTGENDSCNIKQTRQQTWDRARDKNFDRNSLIPARILAYHALSDPDVKQDHLRFDRHAIIGTPERRDIWTLNIETYPLKGQDMCQEFNIATKGMRLYLTRTDEKRQLLSENIRIPQSRGCPIDYALSAVVKPLEGVGDRSMNSKAEHKRDDYGVVFISVLANGFEGAIDRHFIAIPLSLQ